MSSSFKTIPTTPYEGQKPGTSGVRVKTLVAKQPNWVANFVQSLFTVLKKQSKGRFPSNYALAVGGDGRYYNEEAVQIIVKIAAANGVSKLLVGENGVMATPALSNIIRSENLDGGILLTASHNPGGHDGDFGIKFNTSNGGAANEDITSAIFAETKLINHYRMTDTEDIDISTIGTYYVGSCTVKVISATAHFVEMCRDIFPVELMKNFVARDDVSILIDCLHGVTANYAYPLFCEMLGISEKSILHSTNLKDFGGLHPDPNLTYAADLYKQACEQNTTFACAFDGDGDRNMIVGSKEFVNPCDSVAVIADRTDCVLQSFNLTGVARSMPTSQALDKVAEKKGVKCYVVPTGWKFFVNLLEADLISICGEESFGTGSNHIREKDGLWAALCWIAILAKANRDASKPLVTIPDILQAHWEEYGRNYFTRYDYEGVNSEQAKQVMENVRDAFDNNAIPDAKCDDFSYSDPVDGSFVSGQGLRARLADGSRFVFRLSVYPGPGTGSSGATIRLYCEAYENTKERLRLDPQEVLQRIVALALKVSKLQEETGRSGPTVIT